MENQYPFIFESSIEEFFNKEEWSEMCDMEKKRYRAIRDNYENMKRMGLPITVPEFMLPRRVRRLQPRDISPSDSDEEWRPKPKTKKKGYRTTWCPPYRQPSATVTSASCQEPAKPKTPARQKTKEKEEVRVYSLRKRPETNYMKLEVPNDDEFIYCEECNAEYDGDCPVHGPLLVVADSLVPEKKRGKWNRAIESLPDGLEVRESSIPNAGQGVFTTKLFPARTRFGPYQGDLVTDPDTAHASGYCWQLCSGEKPSRFVDAKNCKTANWMRYVNCACSIAEQNVTAYQYQGEIYYRAHRDIQPMTEILVWYGSEYGKELGIIRSDDSHPKRRSADCEVSNSDWDFTFSEGDLEFNDSDSSKCNGKENKKELIDNQVSKATTSSNMTTAYSSKETKCNNSDVFKPTKLLSMEKKFCCQLCSSAFVQFSSLKIHMSSYHGQKYHEALEQHTSDTLADEKSLVTKPSVEELTAEIQTQLVSSCVKKRQQHFDEEDTFKQLSNHQEILNNHLNCKLCGKTFIGSPNIKTHQCIHTGDKPYQCTKCSKAFNRSANLKTHQRIHTGDKPYQCTKCSKAFTRSAHLNRHQRIHTGDKPYQCTKCSKAFTCSANLKTHQRIHTGDKPYQCTKCSKAFTRSAHLDRHQRIHTGDKPYQCTKCSKAFNRSANLKTHQRIHTGDKPYQCTKCSKAFTRSAHLNRHQRIHTGDKPYQCTKCSKAFTCSANLKTHQRIHTGDKPYQCTKCSKAFTRSAHLDRHQRIHTGDKPYQCTKCSKAFTRSAHLNRHQRIHTGDKPYQCTKCSKAFTRSAHLNRHQRIHTGDKPYQCTKCSKTFNCSSHLNRHQRIHTGDKPYQCTKCSKAFTRSTDLNTHQCIHMGDKPNQCTD